MDLPKYKTELLSSRLQEWNLMAEKTKVISLPSRQNELTVFHFHLGIYSSFCSDMKELMLILISHKHSSNEWHQFS